MFESIFIIKIKTFLKTKNIGTEPNIISTEKVTLNMTPKTVYFNFKNRKAFQIPFVSEPDRILSAPKREVKKL